MKRTVAAAVVVVGLLGAGAVGFLMGARRSATRAFHTHAMSAAGNVAGDKVMYYRCPMHPWITDAKPAKCPICAMALTAVYEGQGDGNGIRIDAATARTIGVTTEEVTVRSLSRQTRLAATVSADESRIYSVTSRVMGYAERVPVNTAGRRVSKGETLLELYSPSLVSAQEEYLRALAANDAKLAAGARQRLLGWDVPSSVIDSLDKKRGSLRLIPIVSPASGVVADKMVVQGQSVMAGMQLYRIADLSRVWAVGEAYQSDLGYLTVGRPAAVAVDFLAGKSLRGTVSFVSPELDPESRTASVRVELDNLPDWSLRPGMTATVTIAAPVASADPVVSEQSVIHSGLRDIVIVSLGNGYFAPREVRLGAAAEGYVQVLDGVHEHERVVTSSQFLIDAESNLRAAVRNLAGAQGEDSLHGPAANVGGRTGGAASLSPQKTCPIMGEPINKKLFVDSKGRRIYVCCSACIAQVKQDPEKAIRTLAARGEGVERLKR